MKKRWIVIMICLCMVFLSEKVWAAEPTGDGDFSYIEGSQTERTSETDCQITVVTECPTGFGLNTCVELSDADGQLYRISLSEENGYKDLIYLGEGRYKVLAAKVYDDNTGRYPFEQTEGEKEFTLKTGQSASLRFRLQDYDAIQTIIAAKELGESGGEKTEAVPEKAPEEEVRFATAIGGVGISAGGDLYYPVEASGSGIGEMQISGNAKGDYDVRIEIIKTGVIGEARFSLSLDGGRTIVGDDVTAERFTLKDYGLVLAFHTDKDSDELQKGDVFTAKIPETFFITTSRYGETNVLLAGSPEEDHDLVVTILSSGGRGNAKFTVSLDAGNTTFATDTIPVDGIYELTDGMKLCFSDSDEYVRGTEYTAEVRSNVETVSMIPLYVLMGVVIAAGFSGYVLLLTKRERPADYKIRKWRDRQEPEAYE